MRISVKAGIVAGLLAGGWMISEYYLGFSHSVIGQFTGFVALIFLIIGIYFSIRLTRKHEYNNLITYRHAVKAGIITASITAVIMAISALILYEFIDTTYAEYWLTTSEKYWRSQKYAEADIQKSVASLREALATDNQVQKVLLSTLFFGVVTSLIMAAFMKTKKQDSTPAEIETSI